MAPTDSKHDCRLEAGLLPTAGEEKTNIAHLTGPGNSTTSGRPATPARKMSLLRRAVLAVFLCFIMGFSLTTAASPRPLTCHDDNCDMFQTKATNPQADSKIYQLLKSASPEALHEFLHTYFPDKYQHGVYETDDEAVEAVLQADQPDQPDAFPPLPQLVRRQDDGGNGTVTTTSVPPDTTTEISTTLAPPTTSTTISSSEPSTTSEAPETSTTSDEPSTTTTEAPTSDGTLTSEGTSSLTSSSSLSSSSSPSETVSASISTSTETTTSAEATTSIEPTKIISSSPVPHTFTRTLGDGGTTVITSTSWVAVGSTEQTTASEPDLQDDASRPRGGLAMAAAVAALAGAILIV